MAVEIDELVRKLENERGHEEHRIRSRDALARIEGLQNTVRPRLMAIMNATDRCEQSLFGPGSASIHLVDEVQQDTPLPPPAVSKAKRSIYQATSSAKRLNEEWHVRFSDGTLLVCHKIGATRLPDRPMPAAAVRAPSPSTSKARNLCEHNVPIYLSNTLLIVVSLDRLIRVERWNPGPSVPAEPRSVHVSPRISEDTESIMR